MSIAELKVELREETGKQKAKAIRKAGRVPGIYYSNYDKPRNISIDTHELTRLLVKEFTVLNVIVGGKEELKCIIREIQRDPVTDAFVHVDLLGVRLDEKVSLSVPVVLKGTAAGVREGGILEQLLREVEIEGLPLDIPEHIQIDVTDMNIGDTIMLSDVVVDKYEFVTELKQPLAHVSVSKAALSEGLEEEEEEGEEGEETEE